MEFFGLIFGLLIYGGPLFPIIGILFFRNKNESFPYKRFFVSASIIHIIAFVPFTYGVIMKLQDVLHALFFPALSGLITFLVGMVLLILTIKKLERKNQKLEISHLKFMYRMKM